MQTFKEKIREYYPADHQDKVADHFMKNDSSRHGMHQEDMTRSHEGVAPERRFKKGGHVSGHYEEGGSPTGRIGQKVNEAVARTSHKRGGHVEHRDFGGFLGNLKNAYPGQASPPQPAPVAPKAPVAPQPQQAVPNAPKPAAQAPSQAAAPQEQAAPTAKRGGHMHKHHKHRDFGGFMQKAAQGVGNLANHAAQGVGTVAGTLTKPARNAASSFAQGFQNAKKGGHMSRKGHYEEGGKVPAAHMPNTQVKADIGLNPHPVTSAGKMKHGGHCHKMHRAMGGAGKVRKGIMSESGRELE